MVQASGTKMSSAGGAANFGGSRHFMAAGLTRKRVRRLDSRPHLARPICSAFSMERFAELKPAQSLSRRHRSRHRLLRKPRNHLIPIRDLPHCRRDNGRCLLHIVRNNPFIRVEIRVMRHAAVLDWILLHPDPRQSRVIERRAIRSARLPAIGIAYAAHAPIGEQPEHSARNAVAASGGPNTLPPRGLPVPESMLK